jgi:hypothetical protein
MFFLFANNKSLTSELQDYYIDESPLKSLVLLIKELLKYGTNS